VRKTASLCALLWAPTEVWASWLDVAAWRCKPIPSSSVEAAFSEAFRGDAGSCGSRSRSPTLTSNAGWGTTWLAGPRSMCPDQAEAEAHTFSRKIDRFRAFWPGRARSSRSGPRSKAVHADVLWIGIGGSALGPFCILRPCRQEGVGPALHFFDNVDPGASAAPWTALARSATRPPWGCGVRQVGAETPGPMYRHGAGQGCSEGQGRATASPGGGVSMAVSALDRQAESEQWLAPAFDMFDWVAARHQHSPALSGCWPAL